MIDSTDKERQNDNQIYKTIYLRPEMFDLSEFEC